MAYAKFASNMKKMFGMPSEEGKNEARRAL